MKKALLIAAAWWFLAIVPNGSGGWTVSQYPIVGGAGFFNAADCDAMAKQLVTINPQVAVTQCWNSGNGGGLQ